MRFPLRTWPLLLVLALGLTPALAAGDDDTKDLHPYKGNGAPAVQMAPADAGDKTERPPPTLAYAVAVLATVIVLCIICVPSRKAESSTSR